jgi:hypothetical protein
MVRAMEFVNGKQSAANRDKWIKEYEPALRAKALDEFRAGLPNPDAGRSVMLPRNGRFTAGQIASMSPEEYAANKERLKAQLAAT